LAAVLAGALVVPGTAMADVGTVSGTVTPVSVAPEVEVCVVEIGVPSENCDRPDSTGTYHLSQVPTGINRIEFIPSHRSGYLTQYYRFVSRLQEARTIFVPPSPSVVSGIDAALEPGAEIKGTVTARSTGMPIPALEVCATLPGTETSVSCDETNASGEYTITSLSTGRYGIRFRGQGTSGEFGEQAYGGGALVQVEAGQVQTGIDAELAKGAEVTGIVSAALGGGRLADVPVCLFAVGEAAATQCAFTDALGGYALHGIATGSYQVGFSLSPPTIGGELAETANDGYLTQYFDGVPNRSEARTVVLAGEEVMSGVDAALQAFSAPPPPAPPAPVTSNVVAPPPLITEPTKPRRLKCKKGFVKKKVKRVVKCVKKPAKKRHKRAHKHRKKTKRHAGRAHPIAKKP
jgi:hypothetical protein